MRLPALLAISVALLLTACTDEESTSERVTSTAPVVQLGAPGVANRTLDTTEVEALDLTVEHSQADVEFVRHMLKHHEQAIIMTGYVNERTDDESVRLLAERMAVSQDDEIDQMEAWLRSRGEPIFDLEGEGHGSHAQGGELMPGMLTAQQLAALESASGDNFNRLFLESMIMHHEGAIVMVQDLWDADGGQEVQIGELARHVESDQRIEISRMTSMLEQTG